MFCSLRPLIARLHMFVQNHMLFSLQENWSGVTAPALVSMLPIPQRYYVPSRIRTSHKARLEAVELWHVPEVEEEDEEPRKVFGKRKKTRPVNEPHKFKTFLEREKVLHQTSALGCNDRCPRPGR